jgi:hypothetical protein
MFQQRFIEIYRYREMDTVDICWYWIGRGIRWIVWGLPYRFIRWLYRKIAY